MTVHHIDLPVRTRETIEEHRAEHPRAVFGCTRCIWVAEVAGQTHQQRRDEDRERERDWHRRLRERRLSLIAAGTNPGSMLAIAEGTAETCGSCALLREGHRGRYFKCGHPSAPTPTGGPKTDIRKRWPACVGWKAS